MQAELDAHDLEVCERCLQRADLIAELVRERAALLTRTRPRRRARG